MTLGAPVCRGVTPATGFRSLRGPASRLKVFDRRLGKCRSRNPALGLYGTLRAEMLESCHRFAAGAGTQRRSAPARAGGRAIRPIPGVPDRMVGPDFQRGS